MTSLNDTITFASGSDTITLTNDGSSIWGVPEFDTITLNDCITSSLASGIYGGTISTGSAYTITGTPSPTYIYNNSSMDWKYSTGNPFVDNFPEWNDFRKLCNDYPGLEKAYSNLKTCYTICYEDQQQQLRNKKEST